MVSSNRPYAPANGTPATQSGGIAQAGVVTHGNPEGFSNAGGEVVTFPVPREAADRLDFVDHQRQSGDFQRAKRHSKRVSQLKWLLPISAFIIIAMVIAAFVFRTVVPVNITIGKTGVENGKLVMNNPNLNGFDAKKRPFSLKADRAIQSVEDPTQVELENIVAKLPLADKLFADVVAANGSFDANSKNLELGGGILINTNDGMKMELSDAYIDVNAGTMKTHRPIAFTSDKASISAQSLEIHDNGDRVIFETDVKLVLNPAKLREAAKIKP